MAKEITAMTKPELLSHIATLNETIAASGDAQALQQAKTTIEEQKATIDELMDKVAALDAEPKAESETVKIDGKKLKLKAPSTYVKNSKGDMVKITFKAIQESKELQSLALESGLLVEEEKAEN